MTRSVLRPHGASSREIHDLVTASVHGGSSLYALDQAALEAAEPDLILTQELCAVCAVGYREVNEVARRDRRGDQGRLARADLDRGHPQHDHDGRGDGRGGGRGRRAGRGLRTRLGAIEQTVQQRRDGGQRSPRVVGLEWLDPPFAVGHWVPEQIRRAGGWDLLGESGERSRETTWRRRRGCRPGDARPDAVRLSPRRDRHRVGTDAAAGGLERSRPSVADRCSPSTGPPTSAGPALG